MKPVWGSQHPAKTKSGRLGLIFCVLDLFWAIFGTIFEVSVEKSMFDPKVQFFGPAGRLQDQKIKLLCITPICGQKQIKNILHLATKQEPVQKLRRLQVGAGVCGRVRVGAVGCGCGLARVRVETRERGEPCSCYRPPELPLLLGAGTV